MVYCFATFLLMYLRNVRKKNANRFRLQGCTPPERRFQKYISSYNVPFFMMINLKRRDGVRQSTSLLSTRTVTSWLGVWEPVDFERKYLLEKVNQSNNGFEITNLTFISFGNNLCCRRINRYSSKGSLLVTLYVSRCVQMSGCRT